MGVWLGGHRHSRHRPAPSSVGGRARDGRSSWLSRGTEFGSPAFLGSDSVPGFSLTLVAGSRGRGQRRMRRARRSSTPALPDIWRLSVLSRAGRAASMVRHEAQHVDCLSCHAASGKAAHTLLARPRFEPARVAPAIEREAVSVLFGATSCSSWLLRRSRVAADVAAASGRSKSTPSPVSLANALSDCFCGCRCLEFALVRRHGSDDSSRHQRITSSPVRPPRSVGHHVALSVVGASVCYEAATCARSLRRRS